MTATHHRAPSQALLLNGLWDHHDDDCHSLMKTKLQAVGLKVSGAIAVAIACRHDSIGSEAALRGRHCAGGNATERFRQALAVRVAECVIVCHRAPSHVTAHIAGFGSQRVVPARAQMPRITVRGKCGDVRPGEKVTLKVDVSRAHAFSAEELAAYRTLQAEGVGAEAEVRNEGDADAEGSAAETTEGWWLFVESIRGLPQLNKAGMQNTEQQHNQLVARVALAPSLDAVGCSSELQFVAPSTAGEYKVIVHVRSCSMIGVDARRKVSFVVRGTKRPAPPSSSSGTSTEPCETMEAMEEAIAELQAEILEEEEGEAAAGKQRPEKAPEDAPVVAAAVEAEVA